MVAPAKFLVQTFEIVGRGLRRTEKKRPHADRDRPGRKHSLAAINIGEHHVPGHFMSVQLYAN